MVWLKRLALVLTVPAIAVIVAAWLKPLPGDAETPAGFKRNSAYYVPAADGTRIALDLWLPEDLAADAEIPTLIEGSRYWRNVRPTLAGRIMNLFGTPGPGMLPGGFEAFFTGRGYAYVHVEVRGTGASFGVHDAEYSLQEMADYAAILDWIIARPWSNGRVGAIGVSYAGTTAELMTTTGHPALKAAAPLYSDFDTQYHLATPGGIYQPAFVQAWSTLVLAMDSNNICLVIGGDTLLDCLLGRLMVGGIKPVDGPEGAELGDAIAQHDSPDPTSLVDSLKFRDSNWGDTAYSSLDNQAYGRKAEIEASGVPMYVTAGWFDAATVEGALARFMSFSNTQTVVLAPFSHGGGYDTDPFRAEEAAPVWSRREQLDRMETFFAAHLKEEGTAPARNLSYYVMNGGWRQTDSWPPPGFADRHFYLQPDGMLAPTASPIQSETDYTVDFGVGTEPDTRWMTQLGGGDVIYDARNEATAGAMRFETPPLEADMELTGTVVLNLLLESDRPDGALHAYLDAVAPDGQAFYLTEGVLRLLHRKTSTDTPVYPHFGPYHSYLEKDAAPMPVGTPTTVDLGLYTTSVRVPAGYRLRLSLAGADATSFARVPESGDAPNWRVLHGGVTASRISVPLRPWNAQDTTP
jgi:predicted acyl esterase